MKLLFLIFLNNCPDLFPILRLPHKMGVFCNFGNLKNPYILYENTILYM